MCLIWVCCRRNTFTSIFQESNGWLWFINHCLPPQCECCLWHYSSLQHSSSQTSFYSSHWETLQTNLNLISPTSLSSFNEKNSISSIFSYHWSPPVTGTGPSFIHHLIRLGHIFCKRNISFIVIPVKVTEMTALVLLQPSQIKQW